MPYYYNVSVINSLFSKKDYSSLCKIENLEYICTHKIETGKSYTVSSLRIPQGLTAARVVGCSDAM